MKNRESIFNINLTSLKRNKKTNTDRIKITKDVLEAEQKVIKKKVNIINNKLILFSLNLFE